MGAAGPFRTAPVPAPAPSLSHNTASYQTPAYEAPAYQAPAYEAPAYQVHPTSYRRLVTKISLSGSSQCVPDPSEQGDRSACVLVREAVIYVLAEFVR